MAFGGVGKKGIRLRKEDLMCAAVTVGLLIIRCQDTINEYLEQ
jgi:hypothetical protein